MKLVATIHVEIETATGSPEQRKLSLRTALMRGQSGFRNQAQSGSSGAVTQITG